MKGLPCLNPDCMYLHEMVDEKYYVTKEEMALGYFYMKKKVYECRARHLLYPEGMVPKQERFEVKLHL